MKKFFLPCLILTHMTAAVTGIYTITIQDIGNQPISMSGYQNKKIIVAVVNPTAPESGLTASLDSLASADTTVKLIVVPGLEYGSGNSDSLSAFAQTLSQGSVLMKPSYTAKGAGANQHPLFVWLTSLNENGHFDTDVTAAGQVFVISRSGILYAVLNEISTSEIINIINQDMQ